jgi:nucleotide-binding universal stress UspA family protein
LHDLKLQIEGAAQDYLERIAERWRANSLKVHTRMIAHEQPATAILDTASSLGADAIALTTRGQGGLKRLLLGSVADKVIRGATTPVLICPPAYASEASRDLP